MRIVCWRSEKSSLLLTVVGSVFRKLLERKAILKEKMEEVKNKVHFSHYETVK